MIVGIRWMVCEELLVIASEWGGGVHPCRGENLEFLDAGVWIELPMWICVAWV